MAVAKEGGKSSEANYYQNVNAGNKGKKSTAFYAESKRQVVSLKKLTFIIGLLTIALASILVKVHSTGDRQ